MSRLGHAIAARRINITTFTERIECFYTTGDVPTAGTPYRVAPRAATALAPTPGQGTSRRGVAS
ncbi:hypothetical protein BH11ACT8_BH11ACT8_30880 [soil metagenome]